MKQHYIPVFYLKGFTDHRNKPFLWLHEKGDSNIRKVTAENIAVEKNYYSFDNPDGSKNHSLENLLSKIEAGVSPVFQKIQNFKPLDQDERIWFAGFLNLMSTRVPNFKDKMTHTNIEFVKKFCEFWASDPDEFKSSIDFYQNKTGNKIYDSPEKLEELRREMLDLEKYYRLELNHNFILKLWAKSAVNPIISMVYNELNWTFLVAPPDYKFITSDNPVFRFDPIWNPKSSFGVGLAKMTNPKIEVTFPISQEIAFLGSWQKVPSGWVEAKNTIVKEINRRTIISASRFVFTSQKSDLINRTVQKYRNCKPKLEIGQLKKAGSAISSNAMYVHLANFPYSEFVTNDLSSLSDTLRSGKKFSIFISKQE